MSHSHSHSHNHDDHDDDDDDHTPHPSSSSSSSSSSTNLHPQIDFDRITTLNEAIPGSGAAVVRKRWSERLGGAADRQGEGVGRDGGILAELRSAEGDEQVILSVPFTSQVTLHNLLIHGRPDATAAQTVHLYRNRAELDFSTAADLPATQTLQLPIPPATRNTESNTGNANNNNNNDNRNVVVSGGGDDEEEGNDILRIPLPRARWNATTSISIFFERNHSHPPHFDSHPQQPASSSSSVPSSSSSSSASTTPTIVTYLGFEGTWMRLSREPVSVLYEAAARPADHELIQGVGGVGGVGIGGM